LRSFKCYHPTGGAIRWHIHSLPPRPYLVSGITARQVTARPLAHNGISFNTDRTKESAEKVMAQLQMTRRVALKQVVAVAASAVTAPYVRGVSAAGRITMGCLDHWVPGANNALLRLCNQWGEENHVEVQIDFITTLGEKDKLTAAAEAQAGTGHDIMSHRDWNINLHHRMLEPVNDVVERLTNQYGSIGPMAEYLANVDGV
jgi:hypothetical protein